ncbi:hypothetical protein H5410_024336 [Solanum commersonii]|uniref:Uncharacterized protein n=1 Tax=Solanum commersonii TaxID=4109 RepID=A0A9J5ZLP9_SOLCO|nr:hypothetical protein H5410_024336 [Solanum commersonii]
MDESSPSMRITRGSMAKYKQVQVEQSIEELRSKKKNDPLAIQKVINNAKGSGIKIVEGGSKRKAINIDSEEIRSASSELDKSEEHQEYQGVRFMCKYPSQKSTHMQCYTQIKILHKLQKRLPPNQYNRICFSSCFA